MLAGYPGVLVAPNCSLHLSRHFISVFEDTTGEFEVLDVLDVVRLKAEEQLLPQSSYPGHY